MANAKSVATKVPAGTTDPTDTGRRYKFSTGAQRESLLNTRFDLIPANPLRRLASRFDLGANKYGDWNWQKGLPFSDTYNHIIEHLLKHKENVQQGRFSGDDDLSGAMWGICVLMEQEERHRLEVKREP